MREGISIGERSLIGMGALVTRDVPAEAAVVRLPRRATGSRAGCRSGLTARRRTPWRRPLLGHGFRSARGRSTRIVITGGAGFIGSHIAERLAGSADLVLFDSLRRNSLASTDLASLPNVTLVEGDIRDKDLVLETIRGADAVLHLAAIAGVSSYYKEPETTLRVNIDGTANVVDAVVTAGVPRLVYLSTSEVHGPEAHDVTEESPCAIGPSSDRRWVYATSKLAGEHLVLRGGETHGFAATVLRPFNVYGPRQTGEGAIRNFCLAATSGENLVSTATARRSAPVLRRRLRRRHAPGPRVARRGRPDLQHRQPGRRRRHERPRPRVRRAGPRRRGRVRAGRPRRGRLPHARDRQGDRAAGLQPRVSLREGLERTIQWTKSTLREEVAA